MAYVSATASTPRISPASSVNATSSPTATAKSAAQDSVIGSGQNSPFSRRMSRHAPRQSAAPMKPASGEYAPMANMKRSETSRLDKGSFFRPRARFRASFPLVGGQQQGVEGGVAVRGDQRRHGP